LKLINFFNILIFVRLQRYLSINVRVLIIKWVEQLVFIIHRFIRILKYLWLIYGLRMDLETVSTKYLQDGMWVTTLEFMIFLQNKVILIYVLNLNTFKSLSSINQLVTFPSNLLSTQLSQSFFRSVLTINNK